MLIPIPQQAINLILSEEGCLYRPYRDSAGLWTIGIGHLIKDGESFSSITLQEAHDLLRNDMQIAALAVHRLITRSLNENQFSSILSFTYNEGAGTLQRSTLRRKCNRLEDDDVPHEFMKYIYAKDPHTGIQRRISGLISRRAAEAKLYMAA